MDREELIPRHSQRGSRGGAGPSGFSEFYTGPGGATGSSRMPPKQPRLIKGVTLPDGTCLYCGHKSACKCDCPPCHVAVKAA